MKPQGLFLFPLLLLSFAHSFSASADEQMLKFHSEILVHEDGSMEVTENITVRAEGIDIQRGIYRDFPTRYEDRLGRRYRVGFEVSEVLRDGKSEPYHLKGQGNGERVYMGSADTYLKPGIYRYTMKYHTDRQLGFFPDHDELYWNVTGNGWEFPIRHASASVVLPEGVPKDSLRLEAYTGPEGAIDKNYRNWIDAQGQIHFESTMPLGPREGLTIVVGWPKGFVKEPSSFQKAGFLFRENLGWIGGLLGTALVFFYYFVVWLAVGKDPEKGTVFPRFEAPKNFSPATVRFVRKMGFDDKTFAAALLDLAVKGFLSIKEEGGTFVLHKLAGKDQKLFPGEVKLLEQLPEQLELKNKNHQTVAAAIKSLKNSLTLQCEKIYFLKNTLYMIPGFFLTIIVLFFLSLDQTEDRNIIMAAVIFWLSFWSMGFFSIARAAVSKWRSIPHGPGNPIMNFFRALTASFSFLLFLIGEIAGLVFLWLSTSAGVVVILLLLALTNYLFYRWLKAPTHAGSKLLDEIEGFRLFLTVTERERLNLLNPPERTPELFEKYLPFALALDVEQLWAEQFTDVLARAVTADKPYSPGWYSGRYPSGNYSALASSLGTGFTGVISSSSTAPGSRSGFSGGGGGGSSGGGGGGGGGGGW